MSWTFFPKAQILNTTLMETRSDLEGTRSDSLFSDASITVIQMRKVMNNCLIQNKMFFFIFI